MIISFIKSLFVKPKYKLRANSQSYRLIKDLPNLKAGKLLHYDSLSNFYIHVKNDGQIVGYPRDIVEVYRKWFEPINQSEADKGKWWE